VLCPCAGGVGRGVGGRPARHGFGVPGAVPVGHATHATSEFAPATVEAGRAYTRGGVDVIGRDHDAFADLVF